MDKSTIGKIIKRDLMIFGAIVIAVIFAAHFAEAIIYYSPSASLGTGDITTKHILNGTILREDISQVNAFYFNTATTTGFGIGTTTPWGKLSVHAQFGTNNSGKPLFVVASSTQSATTSVFTILANGNVGIGTSTPQWILMLTSATEPQLALSGNGGVNQWVMRNAGGNFYMDTASNTTYATSSTAKLTILNNGNVGIGTTSPYASLSVVGAGGIVTDKIFATSTATSTFAGALKTTGTGIEFSDGTIQKVAAVTNPEVLLNDGTIYSSSGASTTVSLTIPAGKMGVDDSLEIYMYNSRSGSAVGNSADILMGTGVATTSLVFSAGNSQYRVYWVRLFNNDSNSVQSFFTQKTLALVQTNEHGTATVNTANKFYISFSVATNGGGDVLNMSGLRVLLYKK